MQIDTDQFAALTEAALLTADKARAVHALGFRAGHRAAERKFWRLILLLVAAHTIRSAAWLRTSKLMYDTGRQDERAALGIPRHASQTRARGHLRLVAGGRHAAGGSR